MQIRSYIKFSSILLLIIATLVTGVAFFLPRLLDVNAYRNDIIEALHKGLNRQVSFSSGSFDWNFGPSFVFNDFSIKEKDGVGEFLSAGRVTVRLALIPLLEKRVELKDLFLERARISLQRNADGLLSIDDLLTPGKDGPSVQFKSIRMKQGSIAWKDLALKDGPLSARATDITLNLHNLSRGRKGSFKLQCELPARSGVPARVSLSGTVRLPAADRPLTESELNCDTDIRQFEPGSFWPYYGRFIPFANPGGRLDVASSLKGRLQDFSAHGKVRLAGASVVWPTVFHAAVAPRSLQIDYSLRMNKNLIDMTSVDLNTDGFHIKGSVQLHDYSGKDPRIVARASTPETFRYEDVRYYVPYGIIEKDTADYIENKIKSGVFKLDTGVLDGRISQISHMEIGDNSNTLLIRGPVEKAVLSYGPKAPTFNNIKGTIELKGKNFNLIGMSGFFGTSPFKLNGSITEYNTDKVSDYPVRMEVSAHSAEVAWLARIAGAAKLAYNGSSALVLTGSGPISTYRLDGDWELKQAGYTFPGAVAKPVGMANHLAFNSVIGKGEARLTRLAYTLPPLALSATALLRFSGTPYLGFDLQTNQFALTDSSPFFGMWQKFHPRGKLRAAIKGSGNPEDFSAMEYNGELGLTGFSFTPGERLKAVSGINGSITFRGNSLETGSMIAHYGSSLVTLKGSVKSLHNPEAEISLSSPELFLRDVNPAYSRPDTSIKRLKGTVAIRNGRYNLKSVSGLLNNSNFNISGYYQGGGAPETNLSITSTKLDIDDLKLLSGLEAAEAGSRTADTDATIKLNVESGKYAHLPFSRMTASAQKVGDTIYLQQLNATVFGGKLSARGRIAPAPQESTRYDLNVDLERIDAEKLFWALQISREITGTLSVHGDLTARGATLADVKKSALGNIKLHLKQGKLRKFNTLSKVFSILNVSQLLKFQLPDMVSGGMPYNDITGSLAVKDGSIASSDLFISSDAINISLIGQANIVRETLDLTIGVQPLQTVDKIVNRIPIVGWLLTGKDRNFLTAYFEAKGSWADPQVSAIPVKSMGKGALEIFRRAFELPVRLFTDTGEVILGQ